MKYDELSIEIRGLGGEGSAVEVRSSSYGRGTAAFRLPLEPGELGTLMETVEWEVRHLFAPPEERAEKAHLEPVDPKQLGESLFEALFTGGTASTFQRSFARIEGRADDDGEPLGLRVRLVFDPENPDLTLLGVIPWELLRRPATREFLATDRRTPIVRCLDVPRPERPLPVEPPLRVLLVDSAPSDLVGLALSEERRRIAQALDSIPEAVELERLPMADLRVLREILLAKPFHVLHFMGHGDLVEEGPNAGEGILYFEQPDGRKKPVPAETFAAHIKGIASLKLVVLNACTTGALPRHGGRDPFNATAASLAMADVPAVVGMQFPVSDPAAIAFSQTLYRRLAAHDPIEAAVAEGRLAILADQPRALEWITPVLYLRGDDGHLFAAPPARARGERPAPEPPPEPPPESRPESGHRPSGPAATVPLRLGIRSLVGLGEGLEDEAGHTLSLVRHFDGRPIRDEALWAGAVVPEVREFLQQARTARRPVVLDLAAHHSIAFLCGALLEAKAGVELSIVQRGLGGKAYWFPAKPGEVVEGPVWRSDEEDVPRDSEAEDLAVAVGVTHPVAAEVEEYLERTGRPVRRILRATVPEPSPTSVRDGAHALRLAQVLARRIRGRPAEERGGTVHLFAAAPNALMVYLGQLAPVLGPVQVYEYGGLDGGARADYWPGLLWSPRSNAAQDSPGSGGSGTSPPTERP